MLLRHKIIILFIKDSFIRRIVIINLTFDEHIVLDFFKTIGNNLEENQ